ncbi:MAG TPA: J domain-containing protein [Rhodopila sp.]
MLQPRTRLDPEGFYARLGLEPSATHASIVAAFRAKARVLHPDVQKTGNAEAFVTVRQAYDVLSNRSRREAYDRKAREAGEVHDRAVAASRDRMAREAAQAQYRNVREIIDDPLDVEELAVRPPPSWSRGNKTRLPRVTGLPVTVWLGMAAFLCLCVYEAATHLLAPASVVNAGIRPNAATVEPLSPSAHRAVLYGPAPVLLAGTPNFYVVPAGHPAILWRFDPSRNALVSIGQLPPFSSVQALRLVRQTGMLEVLMNDQGRGFISADHLAPGNARAARTAYCGYNAGPTPFDGELLERHGTGNGTLALDNRGVQPAVVKLRNTAGAVVVSIFLAPGSHADLEGLPEGLYRPEFAIGELWSRACNTFAAGMRALRINQALRLPGATPIIIAPDGGEPPASDIPDQAFERN